MTTTKDAPNLQLSFVEIVSPRLWMSKTLQTTYKTTTPAAAFDVGNPGAGWYDCGTIKAVRIPYSKEIHEKKAGLPRTSRKQWETDRSAQVTFNTDDLSPFVEALIMGQTVFNTLGGTAAAESSHVASLYTGDTYARSKCALASNPTLAEHDIVVCGSPTAASLETSLNMAVVESLAASVLTLKDNGFPIDMAVKDVVRKVDAIEHIDVMGSDTPRSAILFWDVALDSSGNTKIQNALFFPKLYNFSGGDFDFKDGAEPYDVGVTLSAQAVQMTFSSGDTGYALYKKWMLNY